MNVFVSFAWRGCVFWYGVCVRLSGSLFSSGFVHGFFTRLGGVSGFRTSLWECLDCKELWGRGYDK